MVKSSIKELLLSLNINANIETKIRDRKIKYEIYSKNNSVLIGKKGHILESIQTYVRQAVFNAVDIYVIITIDVENYKEKQNYFLEKKVKKIAKEVLNTKVESVNEKLHELTEEEIAQVSGGVETRVIVTQHVVSPALIKLVDNNI